MASEPLELLPDAEALDGSELAYVVQNGSSRKVAVSQLGGGGGSGGYYYGSFAVSAIGASEILLDHLVGKAHTIAANFAGCVADAGVLPTAPWVADIQHNNASIGTLTIAVDGTVTFSATAEIAIAVEDTMTLIAPADVDATLGRFRVTFKGN